MLLTTKGVIMKNMDLQYINALLFHLRFKPKSTAIHQKYV